MTLLNRISAVLSQSTFGIAIGCQSFADAERTMYALVSATNSIRMLAMANQAPSRYRAGEKRKASSVAFAAAVAMKAVAVFRPRTSTDADADYLISACDRCRHYRLLLLNRRELTCLQDLSA